MARITNKSVKQIGRLLSDVISLNNIEEFDYSFKDAPEFWTDEAKRLCDYQGRIINELQRGLEDVLNTPEGPRKKKHSYTLRRECTVMQMLTLYRETVRIQGYPNMNGLGGFP